MQDYGRTKLVLLPLIVDVLKVRHAFLSKLWKALVLQIVPVEVIEHSFHQFGEHGEVGPTFDEGIEHAFTCLPLREWNKFVDKIRVNDAFEVVIKMVVIIFLITLVEHQIVYFHVVCIVCDSR